MAGEDISFYFKKAKGALGFLGVGGPGCVSLHNPTFDVPEDLLINGTELYVRIAQDLLGRGLILALHAKNGRPPFRESARLV